MPALHRACSSSTHIGQCCSQLLLFVQSSSSKIRENLLCQAVTFGNYQIVRSPAHHDPIFCISHSQLFPDILSYFVIATSKVGCKRSVVIC
jgi:hypothetical protein